MGTKNRRVATYLPPDVDEKFKEYKEQNSVDGDSEALINILRDYLGVAYQESEVGYLLLPDLLKRVEALESEEFVTRDQLDALKANVTKDITLAISPQLKEKGKRPEEKPDGKGKDVAVGPVVKSDQNFNATDLAKRLGMGRTTVSNWKSDDPKRGKTPDQLLEITRAKDPDGIGWVFLKDKNVFAPECEIPSNPKIIQGEIGA